MAAWPAITDMGMGLATWPATTGMGPGLGTWPARPVTRLGT
jgi:hypothetical protein